MAYIVLDFEFNQAYNFEKNCAAEPDPKCRFEIIQIGAVKLNDAFDIVDKFNFKIKPAIYNKIHPYVEKITGITTQSLENERTFPEVFEDFSSFIADNEKAGDTVLCIWGNSDIRALYRNLSYYRLTKGPMLIKYIDVQAIATAYLNYSKGSSIGLKNAAELLNIPCEEGNFHDALYDALYTAKVFKAVKPNKIKIKLFNSSHILTKKTRKVK